MKKRLMMLILSLSVAASLAVPAWAAGPMEYTIAGTGDPEYGKPTSFEAIYTVDNGARTNEDVSKNAALAPPAFGSASADTLHTGTPLTPNLAPGYQPESGAVINGSFSAVQPPALGGGAVSSGTVSGTGSLYVPGASNVTVTNPGDSGYTKVTEDLYYSGGYLGTLKIPTIDLSVKVFQGTGSKTLAKGVGHFEDTSIWGGNVALAAHNRGTNSYFGQIHTLDAGDEIILTTKLGTRTYEVTSVAKVSETDRSSLAETQDNCLTLYTCVRNERDLRWCVRAVEIT